MEFSRQEYRSGLPFPSPRDLPNPGIEPGSPTFQADALTSEPPGKPFTKQEKNSTLLPRNKYLVIVYMLLKYQELSSVNMKYNSNSKNSVLLQIFNDMGNIYILSEKYSSYIKVIFNLY